LRSKGLTVQQHLIIQWPGLTRLEEAEPASDIRDDGGEVEIRSK
jgi:hypothetical protein